MILVPFNSARVFVALGSRVVWRVPNTFAVDGLLRFGPVANSGGSGKKRQILQMAFFFIVDTT